MRGSNSRPRNHGPRQPAPRSQLCELLLASVVLQARSVRFNLTNGERGAQPPCREGGRHPPLSELSDLQRREFHEALLVAGSFEDLPGKWQAAILKPEQNRPKLRVVTGE